MNKKILLFISLQLFVFFFFISFTEARSGCCSSHGGVCGCGCCDGTGLSATCAPYYPQCGSSGSITTQPSTITTPKITTYELDGKTYYSKSDYDNAVEAKFEKEHKTNINSAFQEILERQPNNAELDQWFNYSDDIAKIKNALLATDEYKNLQFSKEHKENIRNTFIEIIGKQPTTQQIDELYSVSNDDINIIKTYLNNNKDKYLTQQNTNQNLPPTQKTASTIGLIIGAIVFVAIFLSPIGLVLFIYLFFRARKKKKENDIQLVKKEQTNIKEKKYKMIYISNSKLVAEMYKTIFEREGFDVKLLSKGDNVINMAPKFNPNLIVTDIILGDMNNPDTNGYDIIKKLKCYTLTKNIPIIILSNLGQKEDIVKGIKAGADDYYIMAEHEPMDIVNKLLEKIINK